MVELDPRTNPFRADLAADHLRETVSVDRYVPAVRKSVILGCTPLRRTPSHSAPLDTELLLGEPVGVYEDKDGWSWVQAETDHYVGYTQSAALGDAPARPTHTLSALRSYIFPEPDLKKPPLDLISMTAALAICGQSGGYSELAGGGWIYSKHLAPLTQIESDPAAVAQRFLGTPYLWGGKTSIGLDCSGLVQVSLARCGLAVPRDTGMQENAIGDAVHFAGDESVLQRGDLVYWPGHVGIWIDRDRFIHANATDMMVAIAPLRDVAAHIERMTGDPIRSVRRPRLG